MKVSGSFMFSWNYWLMMGMSYEQNTMGKGPNESLRVGKQKAKKKRCGSEEGIESHGR